MWAMAGIVNRVARLGKRESTGVRTSALRIQIAVLFVGLRLK